MEQFWLQSDGQTSTPGDTTAAKNTDHRRAKKKNKLKKESSTKPDLSRITGSTATVWVHLIDQFTTNSNIRSCESLVVHQKQSLQAFFFVC